MSNLINKVLILFILILIFLLNFEYLNIILPLLISIILSSISEYFNNKKLNIFLLSAYFLLCVYKFEYITFLPLIVYGLLCVSDKYLLLANILLFLFNINNEKKYLILIIFIIQVIEYILILSFNTFVNEKNNIYLQRDKISEDKMLLESKLNELIAKQNDEVTIATLNERNRIAREIHDNVGHLLSSSILQIGAMIAVSNDENTKKGLITLKTTLDKGMDSIRNSVHNLRDSSIDLNMQIKKLIDNFQFCNIKYKYEISSNLKTEAKYNLILIVKESLNNIIKHSSATEAVVALYEHPKFIQLIISDNGKIKQNFIKGMGLEDIEKRIENMNGIFNINTDNGFKIFISVVKENLI